jgi:predicted nucleotidyltransferase
MRPSETLLRHRDAVHAIICRHRARNPRLFGSAARGEDTAESDLDILVDPEPGMTLFDLGAIIVELEKLLGLKVDIVTSGDMPPRFANAIQNDLRPL